MTDFEPSSSSSSSSNYSSSSSSTSDRMSFSSASSADIPEYGYFDHLGLNWVPDNNEIVYGIHYNIDNFYLSEPTTITLKEYDGNDKHGMLTISANNIYIQGTIDGSNKGYSGGGGGTFSYLGHTFGLSGGAGGGTGGGTGGNGGYGPSIGTWNGSNGGNAITSSDKSIDFSLLMGYGGGGGGGGSNDIYAAGGGGGGGGAGGGIIFLYSSGLIYNQGKIYAQSSLRGGNGGVGVGGNGGGSIGGGGNSGGSGGSGYTGTGGGTNGNGNGSVGGTSAHNVGGNGGNGGYGGGGGVLISCTTFNGTNGTIDVNGGATNGGTIKIFAPNRTDGTYLYTGGRLLLGVNGSEWGVQTPSIDIEPNAWDNWKYKGTNTPVKKSNSYGRIQLYPNEEAVSDVKDYHYVKSRKYTMSTNIYSGTISTMEIRGTNTASFAQSDVLPNWETFTDNMIVDWQYIQIKTKA